MFSNENDTGIPEEWFEEYALKLIAKDSACRSKAKEKPQRRELDGSSPRIVSIGRSWIDTEQRNILYPRMKYQRK